MTEAHEVRISHDELTTLSFTCQPCGAEIVVNVADARQKRAWDGGAQFACPICRANFDSNLKGPIIRFWEWLARVKKSGVTVTFRVPTGNQP